MLLMKEIRCGKYLITRMESGILWGHRTIDGFAFGLSRLRVRNFQGKKKTQLQLKLWLIKKYPRPGIEPAHLAVHDFESCASTSSAT